jgi:hypothetical protein
LPVTVETAGMSIAAVIRLGIHCGIGIVSDTPTSTLLNAVYVKAGIEIAVFAHLAEFITNTTHVPDDKECKLKVIQEYNLALRAIAGASVEVDIPRNPPQTWGPVIETSTAIFTTTLAEVCVNSAKPTTSPERIARRADLTTTTLMTKDTTSVVSCMLSSAANCPASMQNTTRATYTRYWITAVPLGVTATFPETMFSDVGERKAFGTVAKTVKAMSGVPSAYTAPPSSTDGSDPDIDDGPQAGRGSDKQSIAIGVGVGVGLDVPLLAAILGVYL